MHRSGRVNGSGTVLALSVLCSFEKELNEQNILYFRVAKSRQINGFVSSCLSSC